ncbi:amidohydrolase family protein [uncultured Caballeronia sp.]|uniref:amidohydrolase family protein n=1 Tax=uncultured Caballeronia sp. TaxID=1827198 RepID=UPI0035C98181
MGDVTIGAPSPNHAVPQWRVEDSPSVMDRQGITSAVVWALPAWMKDMDKTRRLARACNDYAAQMVTDHPSRFGTFSCLPVPDAAASVREIHYAVDVLKLDGTGLMTNYGDQYLGDPGFSPVFDELNRPQGGCLRASHFVWLQSDYFPVRPLHSLSFRTTLHGQSIACCFQARSAVARMFDLSFTRRRNGSYRCAHGHPAFSRPDLSKRVSEGVMPALRRL